MQARVFNHMIHLVTYKTYILILNFIASDLFRIHTYFYTVYSTYIQICLCAYYILVSEFCHLFCVLHPIKRNKLFEQLNQYIRCCFTIHATSLNKLKVHF